MFTSEYSFLHLTRSASRGIGPIGPAKCELSRGWVSIPRRQGGDLPHSARFCRGAHAGDGPTRAIGVPCGRRNARHGTPCTLSHAAASPPEKVDWHWHSLYVSAPSHRDHTSSHPLILSSFTRPVFFRPKHLSAGTESGTRVAGSARRAIRRHPELL